MVQKRLFGGFVPLCLRDAVEYCFLLLRKRFGWHSCGFSLANNGRHAVLTVFDPSTGWYRRIYLVYQREPFHKFGEYFGLTGEKAVTINKDILDRIAEQDIDFIVWINKKGEAYMISPKTMARLVRENGWVRTTRSGEKTAHIPLSKTLVLTA